MTPDPTIYLVDDDPVVLKSLCWLIGPTYANIEAYSSGAEFLNRYDNLAHGCVVLDMRMPDMTGLEVQARLNERGASIPVIIMTGHADIPVCTQSFRAGVFDFTVKPANSEFLLERIGQALDADVQRHQIRLERAAYAARINELTDREKEVMDRTIEGWSLKKIARELEISTQTVAKHRTKVLAKLQLASDVELVHAALQNAAVGTSSTDRLADAPTEGN
jgi:FixJ family two-component response regulator